MSLITMREALQDTVSQKYALPSVVADGHLFAEGIIKAAEAKKCPVILMLPGLLFGRPDLQPLVDYMLGRIKASPVPMVLHLDHGASIDEVMQAIHLGFSSVMIDASALPYEENLRITREVVRLAHSCGVSVEAEIGHVATPHESIESTGNDTHSTLTRPEEAEKFAKESGVDALAIAMGTVHGLYKEEPHLDFERVRAIRAVTDIPLVMHGSSGLPDDMMSKAVECGINKVNYFSNMSRDAAVAVQEEVKRNPDTVFLHDYLNAAEACIQRTVEHLFDVLGTKTF